LKTAYFVRGSFGRFHMGMDHLDFTFRLEKTFELKLPFETVFAGYDAKTRDLTAGQVHENICRYLQSQGRTVPVSSWHRVQVCAAKASSKKIAQVKPQSRLIADLGFS
jgi:hypothetical protein